MAPVLLPAYQYQLHQDGSWRVRVFNLPALPAPVLPFVTEVCASALGPGAYWRKGVDGDLSVLRLYGPDSASLTSLRLRLKAHGILPVARPGPGRVMKA